MKDEQTYQKGHMMLRSVIFFGFFLLTFQLLWTGNIQYYIAPKMVPFLYFFAAAMFGLGLMQLVRATSKEEQEELCNCGFFHQTSRSSWQAILFYALFIVPILTGIWFPDAVLDSSIAAKRGLQYATSPQTGSFAVVEEESDEEDLAMEDREEQMDESVDFYEEPDLAALKEELLNNDVIVVDDERYNDIMYILHKDLQTFIGKKIQLVGFVYKENDMDSKNFIIARFGITCCVADAYVYGIRSFSDQVQHLQEDNWVKVTGTISTIDLDDWTFPFVEVDELETIEQPDNPYIYGF